MSADPDEPTHDDAPAEIAASRMAVSDLLVEATAGLLARPGRAALTVLGTALGIAALVATIGVAQSAGSQIVTRFDDLTITEVVAEPAQESFTGDERALTTLPWDSEARATRLVGVEAAGTRSRVETDQEVSSVGVHDPAGATAQPVPIEAASPGLLDAVRGQLDTGRFFDAGHDERADPVAVLGSGAAERLGIDRVDHRPAIRIGDRWLTVIGIVDAVGRQPDLLGAVLLPNGYAEQHLELGAPQQLHVHTAVGAAEVVADQVPLALAPDEPGTIRTSSPPSPGDVRSAVEADVNALFLLLGGVSLLIGGLGIANVTLVSVLERVGEIGLRRSLGAARRHIVGQFLVETAAIGLIGGIIGAAAGVVVVVGVAVAQGWAPVLDLWVPLAAPAIGTTVGVLAGLYPAIRAATLEPLEALRS